MAYKKFFENDSIFREQAELCIKFYNQLAELLENDYQTTGDMFLEETNTGKFHLRDNYIYPFGTRKQITYYNKPYWSFRISDHWNWYDTIHKCKQRNYIQCFNVDLPRRLKRTVADDICSHPFNAIQVAIYGNHDDEAYHCVYGTYKDKESREWRWMEKTPQEIIEEYCLM